MERNEFDFSKYITTLENLKFGELTYKTIYEMKAKKSSELGNGYRIVENSMNYFIVYKIDKSGEFGIFFNGPKTVNYTNLNKSQNLIFSTLQIDEFIIKNSIQELELGIDMGEYQGVYYSKFKTSLGNIKNDVFNFKAIIPFNGNYVSNYELLLKDKFSPLDLSKFFYDYFEYNNPDDNEEFVYYETPERANLLRTLNEFYFSNCNYFKFCGPISGGKSTTLLKFKNQYDGILYFNLKTIKKFYLNGNPIYKSIMLYEMRSIILNKEKQKEQEKELNKIIQNNQVLEIIFSELIEFLEKLKIRNILVIDQFRNIDFDSSTFDKIQKKINNSLIGLILSSSIDEKEIKNELILTLSKFYKMPKDFSPKNQNYYFYIPNLLGNKIIKENYISQNKFSNDFIDLFEQFSFKTQYISLLKKKEGIDENIKIIHNQITQKMINQNIFPASVSLEFISLLINEYIDITLEYKEENFNLLTKIPLKFIDVHFDDNYFSLHYGFPYIKTLVEDSKKKIDIKNYFEKNMFAEKFYSQFKGPYFEKAVINSIIDRKIYLNKDNQNNEKIYKIIVNNILDMKETNKENNVKTIINRINNKVEKKSYEEKEYNTYIDDRIKNIEELLNEKNKINFNNFLEEALKEELEILKKELEKIKNKKKSENKIDKQIISLYDEKFKNGNILIEQIQPTGKAVDAAFLFGNKNEKTLILLQMKFYEKTTGVSTEEKQKLDKSYIQANCKKVLSNIYLNLGITIETWHYILILFFNSKDETYNTSLVRICNNNDLEYIFFDPLENKFYNKEKKQIKVLDLNFLTNLNDIEFESNPIKCFQETDIIKSFITKRNRDLTKKISYKEKTKKFIQDFENKYKVSFENFFKKIKNNFKNIKNIKVISFLNMELNIYFPILKDGYGYIFLNNNQNGLIFMGKLKNNENYIILDNNKNEINFLKLNSFINIEEEFIYFVVKLT